MRGSRLSIVLIILIATVSYARSQDAKKTTRALLTNDDVLQMVKSGFSSDLIIAKIDASKTKFDTSPAVLAELKQNGVSETILVAMVKSGAPPKVMDPVPPDLHLDSARSALKALRRLASATEVGVTYANYKPLLADVKTEVDDSLGRIRKGSLRDGIQASLREYEYAASVWQATWDNDFVNGPLREVAIDKYAVQRKGWLKVVWRSDFLNAIWREARNHFEISHSLLSQATAGTPAAGAQEGSDDLAGVWRIILTGPTGQTAAFHLTVAKGDEGYEGTLRSVGGNTNKIQLTKVGSNFTLIATEQEKKKTLSMQFEGTVDSAGMKGNAVFNDGKQSHTLPFQGTKLTN